MDDAATLSARYVFPVEGPPIANGYVAIENGRIASLGPAGDRRIDRALGNVAITPGFVNAHTHLELSPLGADRLDPPEDEIAWLKRVVTSRRESSPEAMRAAVQRNLAAAIASGTSLVADTTTAGLSWPAIAEAPVRGVVFAEVLGLKRERAMQMFQQACEWISSIGTIAQASARARPGLSPHAPYSTAGWLYERAAASRLPLSTHLAEMPEELELLATGAGRLREFLNDIGAWDDEWCAIGNRPADFVRKSNLKRADWVIAHGNYLDPEDFWQLRPEAAPKEQRVAVAYCPRTCARFGHAPHPFREMLKRGGIVCLGTDSLASAPSLSVLDEMRFLRAADPSVSGELLLAMATLFGAWALRAETVTGSLRAGKSADLAVIALPDGEESDPHDLLLNYELPVVETIFEGQTVSRRAST
jgi:cytosine/adenosine deaminase-related metal-dependent hydrolase